MLRKAALTLISTLISLLIVEVILRMFFPVYPVSTLRAYQYDPELGVAPKPGIHSLETTDFQQEIRVNKLGTVNFQETFADYKTLVFAVGDSYTQGTGLPSDMSYPAQLDLLMNSSRNGYTREFGVVNLGLAAYGGEQNLLALRRYSDSIGRPAFILYLGCDNDFQDDQLFNSGYRHGHLVDGNPKWGIFVRPLQWLTNDFQIGLQTKLIIGKVRRGELGSPSTADGGQIPQSVAELERSVLDRANDFSKQAGAKLVVSWAGSAESYAWTREWAAGNNVQFADWQPRVTAVTEAIPQMPIENPHSGGHYRGWVNRIIAEEFGRHISAQ